MPLLIPLIIGLIVVGFGSGVVTQDLFGSNSQEEQTLAEQISASPTPTSKPQVVYKPPETTSIPLIDKDPVITCNWSKGSKCEGQSVNLRKSECPSGGSYVCCQAGDTWQLITSTTCLKIRQNDAAYAEKMRKVIEDSTEKRKVITEKNNAMWEKSKDDLEKRRREARESMEKSRQDFENYKQQTSADTDQFIQKTRDDFERRTKDNDKSIAETKARIKQSEERQKKEIYDMCVGLINDKYSNKSGGIIGQSGGVSGGVYYGTENRAYQDELSGCSILLK
ncbi:MAG: hypothetical protein AAB550_03040 [Patescibacteria group bacterium]